MESGAMIDQSITQLVLVVHQSVLVCIKSVSKNRQSASSDKQNAWRQRHLDVR